MADDDPLCRPPGDPAEFLRLFLANEGHVLAHVFALLPNRADAEDVVQDASAVMWRKFAAFEPGSNFRAWACRIAHLEVLQFRKRKGRQRVVFDDDVVALVADDLGRSEPFAGETATALDDCLARLPVGERELVRLRYRPGATLTSAAEAWGRSVVTARKTLRLVHRALLECLTRKLGLEANP